MELIITVCNRSTPTLLPLDSLTLGQGFLLPFHLPLFYGSGFARNTYTQSRATPTLIGRNTSNTPPQIDFTIDLPIKDTVVSSAMSPVNSWHSLAAVEDP